MPIEERLQQLELKIEEVRTLLFKKTGSAPSDIRTNAFVASSAISSTNDGNLGFYGVAEVNQPETVSDPTVSSVADNSDTTNNATINTNFTNLKAAVDAINDRLQELGLTK